MESYFQFLHILSIKDSQPIWKNQLGFYLETEFELGLLSVLSDHENIHFEGILITNFIKQAYSYAIFPISSYVQANTSLDILMMNILQ